MNIETLRIWAARVLLGFVLVTLGFALGRRTAPLPASEAETAAGNRAQTTQADRVVVYAAHMTFRCPECTQIEWLARELVETEFAAELANGSLAFRTVDYMRDTVFAKQYNIASSTVVVVRIEDGEEKGFRRLDEVWTKTRDRDAFFEYVRSAIRETLGTVDGV
jgi:hypothetical protein